VFVERLNGRFGTVRIDADHVGDSRSVPPAAIPSVVLSFNISSSLSPKR